jgi:hypothetical protein
MSTHCVTTATYASYTPRHHCAALHGRQLASQIRPCQDGQNGHRPIVPLGVRQFSENRLTLSRSGKWVCYLHYHRCALLTFIKLGLEISRRVIIISKQLHNLGYVEPGGYWSLPHVYIEVLARGCSLLSNHFDFFL